MTEDSGPTGPNPPDAVPPAAEPALPPEAAPQAGDAPAPTAQEPEQAVDGSRRGAHRAEPAWQRLRARRAERKQARAGRPHKKAPWWELPLLVVVAILIAIVVKTFVVQPFYIPSESMEHTLYGCPGCHGDRILVNKLIFDFRAPHPGDIVVFHAPPGWNDEPASKPPSNPVFRAVRGFGQLVGVVPPDGEVLVKRVIATGGETVWGVNVNGRSQVHVRYPDGREKTLDEPYVYNPLPDAVAAFGPVTVPKGRLWVMGDHRNDSKDSRYHCNAADDTNSEGSGCDAKLATVPIGDVIGKAFVIAWPPSRWRTLGTPSTFKNAALAGASDIPGMVSAGVVLPMFVLRRRRRR